MEKHVALKAVREPEIEDAGKAASQGEVLADTLEKPVQGFTYSRRRTRPCQRAAEWTSSERGQGGSPGLKA